MAIGTDTLFQRENTTCFEMLFDRHPLPMWVFDQDTLLFTAVNDAGVEKYGFSRREFLSMSLDQIVLPDDLEKVLEDYAPARISEARGGRFRVHRHRYNDGTVAEVETSWSVAPFGGRSVIICVIHDLTARKRFEESNREQVRLLDMASDAIIVCDLAGGITFWNQGAERLYGWKAEEALGSQMVELLSCDPTRLAETEQGVREKGVWSGQLRQLSKAKAELTVNSRWTLVTDDFGDPKSVLVINTDFTETKKLETQFLRTQRLESIGTLASGIAHDLNNILSPILMSVAVLRRSLTTPDNERMLNIIEGSAERGAGIVKQVLTFARGVEGERVLLQP
ncbi:MAG TPA: PAS domain S-box protein, partial [Chthoniobacteraceae bacterium]